MAARKRTTGIETVDENDGKIHLAAPHQGVESGELSPDVQLVLDELGANASAVIIERMKDNKPGEWDYITRLSAEEYKTEYIKEQFGGGEYRVTIIDAVHGRLNPIMISIDRRFAGKLFASMPTPVSVNGAGGDPFRDRLLEVLLAKALTPAPQQNNSRETIELVLAVVGALRGGDGGSSMEQVKMMIETATTLASAMNPPEGIAGVAANYLPVIERMVSSNRQPSARVTHTRALPAPQPPPPVVRAPTQPIATVPAPTPAEPAHVAGSIVPKWLEPFKLYAGQLVKIADRGSDPTMYADLALEEIQDDDETFAAAVDAMNADRLLSDLFAVCPDLEKTEKRKEFAQEFVTKFREGVTEILNSADDDTADAEAGGA